MEKCVEIWYNNLSVIGDENMFFFYNDDNNNNNSNTLSSSIAFETYVLNILKDYLKNQNRSIDYETKNGAFDAILPDGIDDIEGPVFLETKYFSSPGKNIYFQSIMNFAEKMQKFEKGNVLCIIGTNVSEKSIDSMKAIFHSKCNQRIEIWTIDIFEEKTKPFSSDGFLKINKNLNSIAVDSAINNPKSTNENRESKNVLLERLKEKYNNQELALFLGAGVSMDSGIPLWKDLINNLLAKMISKKLKNSEISEDRLNEIIALASSNQEGSSITQMRYIRSAFDNNEYNRLVHDALYSNKVKLNSQLLQSLSFLCIPTRTNIGIKGIITYNFDDVVEQRLKKDNVEYNTIYNERGMTTPDKLSIYHVHGFLPNYKYDEIENPQLIFSEEDYHKVYNDAYCWSNIVQLNYLRENTCLFIGCSLNDPNLRRLLDVASRGIEKPKHYAFMKKPTIKIKSGIQKKDVDLYRQIDMSLKEKCFSSMGINIIWIDNYKEITEILRKIKE